ncbi:MAG: LptA/OstA family protein [Hyphomicrobiales bacterium]
MTKERPLRIIAVLALIALSPAQPMAQTGSGQVVDTKAASKDANRPKDVDVEADQMEVLDKEQRAIFRGNVVATRGGTTVKCQNLVVTYRQVPQTAGSQTTGSQTTGGQATGEKRTEVTFLDASGNTTIVTGTQTITGEKAHMDVKANTVTVEGNVKVVQGKTVVTGQRLFANLNTNRSEMTGGRVKGSFVPGQ